MTMMMMRCNLSVAAFAAASAFVLAVCCLRGAFAETTDITPPISYPVLDPENNNDPPGPTECLVGASQDQRCLSKSEMMAINPSFARRMTTGDPCFKKSVDGQGSYCYINAAGSKALCDCDVTACGCTAAAIALVDATACYSDNYAKCLTHDDIDRIPDGNPCFFGYQESTKTELQSKTTCFVAEDEIDFCTCSATCGCPEPPTVFGKAARDARHAKQREEHAALVQKQKDDNAKKRAERLAAQNSNNGVQPPQE